MHNFCIWTLIVLKFDGDVFNKVHNKYIKFRLKNVSWLGVILFWSLEEPHWGKFTSRELEKENYYIFCKYYHKIEARRLPDSAHFPWHRILPKASHY